MAKKISAANQTTDNSDKRDITGTDFESTDKRGLDVAVLNSELSVKQNPANFNTMIQHQKLILDELRKLNFYMTIITEETGVDYGNI